MVMPPIQVPIPAYVYDTRTCARMVGAKRDKRPSIIFLLYLTRGRFRTVLGHFIGESTRKTLLH